MPLPPKSRYTIEEASQFIQESTGEAVTKAQILDWGTQGFYRLHLSIGSCNIQPIGDSKIIKIQDSTTELRLSGGQAILLGRGERVGLSTCLHEGIACYFVRRSSLNSRWRMDTIYFGLASLVVQGTELTAFAANLKRPEAIVSEAPDVEKNHESAADPERRLALLRELGGSATHKQGKWHFKGIDALTESEKRHGRKRASEKTIRADLIEAANKEAAAKRAGQIVRQMNW